MKIFKYILIISLLTNSCTQISSNKNSGKDSPNNKIQAELIKPKKNKEKTIQELDDSLTFWINTEFESSLNKDISICDCWKEIKYHFLYYDTTKMELYLKSNLMHYGHDHDLFFPMSKRGDVLRYDSTQKNGFAQSKELKMTSKDTLTLVDGDQSYTFRKMVFEYQRDPKQKHFFVSSKLGEIFYNLNSRLLLKYNKIDSHRSTNDLINLSHFNELINNNKVKAHCSDDYGLDGLTIQNDRSRYFQLEFREGEVTLFEHQGRDRFMKLNLDSLPKQVLLIK